jgi:hypothetical protein
VRHFWLRQQETKKIFKVRHVPTSENLADIGTKPLGGDTFLRLRGMIFNQVPDRAWRRDTAY